MSVSLSSGRFVGFVLLFALLVSSPEARALDCTNAPNSVVAGIIGVQAAEDDLEVAIAWGDRVILSDPLLFLRDESGHILASANVTPSGPEAAAVSLPDALADLWNHDFSLVLEIWDEGQPIGEPLPFFALRECTPEDCLWKLLVGLSGNAVVTTGPLDSLISSYGLCDLNTVLLNIEQQQAYLQEEVLQMRHQLLKHQVTLGGSTCGYYWHVVGDLAPLEAFPFYAQTSLDQDVVDGETGGIFAGATYFHRAQARRLSPGVTHPPATSTVGSSVVSVDLVCSSGPPSCAQDCQGEVNTLLRYTQCGMAESTVHEVGGSGWAWAWEEATFLVDSTVSFQQVLDVYSTGGPVQETYPYVHATSTGEPVTFTLTTDRRLELEAGYVPPPRTWPWLDPPGAAHAYAEAVNDYRLEILGDTPGSQCPQNYELDVTMVSLAYLMSTKITEQGGVWIEKW